MVLAAALAAGFSVTARAAEDATDPTHATDGGEARIQFHGYGEVHYNNPQTGTMSSGAGNELDFHRFVLLFNHSFSDRLRFIGELEVEHGFVEGLEQSGELELEQAYLDFRVSPAFNLRAGMLLAPEITPDTVTSGLAVPLAMLKLWLETAATRVRSPLISAAVVVPL